MTAVTITDAQKLEVTNTCSAVLDKNWEGQHTKPNDGLYSHSWRWDSDFHAIGNRHQQLGRAISELWMHKHGQWSNGMPPSMLFIGSDQFDHILWRSKRSPHAPYGLPTTGITQPPVQAEAVYRVGEKMSEEHRVSWHKALLPNIVAAHNWMYRERDPNNSGLITLIHPWESGMDNSPVWTETVAQHGGFESLRQAAQTKLGRYVMNQLRRDKKHVDEKQLARDRDMAVYQALQLNYMKLKWDSEAILASSAVQVEDLAFNAILVRANQRLTEMAKVAEYPLSTELQENMHKTEEALEELWDPDTQQYYSRHTPSGEPIRIPTFSTLITLYSGTTKLERSAAQIQHIEPGGVFASDHQIPSVPTSSPYHDKLAYWSGPGWPNIEWLIADGAKRAGRNDIATNIALKNAKTCLEHGAYEYNNTKTGQGLGAPNFSMSASAILDMTYSYL